VVYSANGESSITTFRYDAATQHLIEEDGYDSAGKLLTRTLLKRNKDGFVVENDQVERQRRYHRIEQTSWEFYRSSLRWKRRIERVCSP